MPAADGPIKATVLSMSIGPDAVVEQGGIVTVYWSRVGVTGAKDFIDLYRAGDPLPQHGMLDGQLWTGGAASGSANVPIPTNLPPGVYQFVFYAESTALPTPSFLTQCYPFYVIVPGQVAAAGLSISGTDQVGYAPNGTVYLSVTRGTPNAGDTVGLFVRGSTSPQGTISLTTTQTKATFPLVGLVGQNQYYEFGLVSGVDGSRLATSQGFVTTLNLPTVALRRAWDRIATNGSRQDISFHTSRPDPSDQIFLRLVGGTWWQPAGEGFKPTGGVQDGIVYFTIDGRMAVGKYEAAFYNGASGQVAATGVPFDVLVSV
jgi:hypothetical protein